MYVASTAGFMMFIIEEAQQQRGFATFPLVQGKMWQEAHEAATFEMKSVLLDRKILAAMYPLNPFAWYFFDRHTDAVQFRIEQSFLRINKELAEMNLIQSEHDKDLERLRQRIQELENLVEAKIPIPSPPERSTK